MADLVMEPGETSEQFDARIRAAFQPPTDEEMELLRRLLPPVRFDIPARRAS